MERLFDSRIGEDRAERGQVGKGEWIDEGGAVRRGHLDEVDAIAIAMKTGRLGVDRDARGAADGSDQLGEGFRPRYVTIHAVSAYSGFASRSMPAAISSNALANVL